MEKKSGLTFVEWLIAIAIVAVLAMIAIPNYFKLTHKPSEEEIQTKVAEEKAAIEAKEKYNRDYANNCVALAKTVGDHSYIPINQGAMKWEDPELILLALKRFEDTHPNWEITGWKADISRFDNRNDRCYGLFIDHRPKQLEENKK